MQTQQSIKKLVIGDKMVVKLDRAFIFIPYPTTRIASSVLIDGVEYGGSDGRSIFEITVTRRVTSGVSNAMIKLRNVNGYLNNIIQTGQVVKIYLDYDQGTTKLFEGLIYTKEQSFDKTPFLIVKALDYGAQAMKTIVNKVYTTETAISTIFTELVSEFLTGYTTNNVTTTVETAQPTFSDKPLFDCFQDLIKLLNSDYDFYFDFDKDLHMFQKGTIFNSNEAVLYSINIKTLSIIEKDESDVYDKITVYGDTIDGVPILYTAGTGLNGKAYRDNGLTSIEEAKAKAQSMLAIEQNTEKYGEVTVTGMPKLIPGNAIFVWSPDQNIEGEFLVNEFTHKLDDKGFQTSFKLQERQRIVDTFSVLFQNRIKQEQATSIVQNPFNMKYSFIVNFDDSSQVATFTNTEIQDNYLKVSSGNSGITATITHDADIDITKAHLKVSGDSLTDITYQVSVDDGNTYQSIAPETDTVLSTKGSKLKIKILFSSSTTRIKTVGILYA